MWSGESMTRDCIKGCNIILRGDMEKYVYVTDQAKDKGVTSELQMLNKTAYNELIMHQEDRVCFQIFQEATAETHKYGDARKAWVELSRKFDPAIMASKKILCNKSKKGGIDNITREPKECITQLELLRRYLQKMNVHINNTEIMAHILSNLPEAYNNMLGNLDENLDDNKDPLNIKRICDKILKKYDQINVQL